MMMKTMQLRKNTSRKVEVIRFKMNQMRKKAKRIVPPSSSKVIPIL